MKNVERNENSQVETNDERLKRLCTNEIDGPKRFKLREEKGWEGGKTKSSWKGKSTNILKRKHQLKSLRKESKDFARVGWLLDYGLRFQEEEWWVGGKRQQLRIKLNDEEARVNLTRNAPDEKS